MGPNSEAAGRGSPMGLSHDLAVKEGYQGGRRVTASLQTQRETRQPASKAQLGSWLQRPLRTKRSQIPLEPGQETIFAVPRVYLPVPWQPHWPCSQSPTGQASPSSLGSTLEAPTSPSGGARAREAWALTPPPALAHLPARGPGCSHVPSWGVPGPTRLTRPDLHMLMSHTSLAPLASLFGERLDPAIPVSC